MPAPSPTAPRLAPGGLAAPCLALGLAAGLALGLACEPDQDAPCGPDQAVVTRVIDGDTVELDTGERVRYLLVDTPEVSNPPDCYGPEATAYNRQLVEGKRVQLSYDQECRDTYDRLLAYVELEGRSVNEQLVALGYACVLQILPNGTDRVVDYRRLEREAEQGQQGLWGMCVDDNPCD